MNKPVQPVNASTEMEIVKALQTLALRLLLLCSDALPSQRSNLLLDLSVTLGSPGPNSSLIDDTLAQAIVEVLSLGEDERVALNSTFGSINNMTDPVQQSLELARTLRSFASSAKLPSERISWEEAISESSPDDASDKVFAARVADARVEAMWSHGWHKAGICSWLKLVVQTCYRSLDPHELNSPMLTDRVMLGLLTPCFRDANMALGVLHSEDQKSPPFKATTPCYEEMARLWYLLLRYVRLFERLEE